MIYTFSLLIILVSLIFIFCRWNKRGMSEAAPWFVAASLIFVNFGFIMRYHEIYLSGKDEIATGVIVVSIGLLSFMFGVLIHDSFRKNVSRIGISQLELIKNPRLASFRLVIVASVIFLPSWAYFFFLGYVPLFDGIGAVRDSGIDGLGALQASRLSRDAYASENGVRIPGQGAMQIARNIGVPMVAAFAIAQINSGYRKPLRLVLLALSVLTVLLAGQRWPLIYLIIAILTSLAMTKRGSLKRIVPVATALVAIGIVVSVLQARTLSGLTSWTEALKFGVDNLITRVVSEQSLIPVLSYEINAYGAGELSGRSYFDSVSAYLPGPGASFPVEFYQKVTGDSHAYTAAPDFFTEAYINFGFLGVAIISMTWGIILSLVDRHAFSADPDLSVGLKSGMVAVLSLSCFTGPAFTISGVLLIVVIKFFAERVRTRARFSIGGKPI